MTIPSYGKVHAFGHRYNQSVLNGSVQVTEKIDGSQISFGIVNGKLCMRSHNQQIDLDAPNDMFKVAVQSIREREHLLRPGLVYRGEFLAKPKHNTLAYERTPDGNIIIFDVEEAQYVYIDSYPHLVYEADNIDLETVPLLYQGQLSTLDECMQLLKASPILGGKMIEGIVIKNYAIATEMGTLCSAKVVNADFKEKNGANWKKENPNSMDVIQTLAARYRTEARWEKAVQHLKEDGLLQDAPQDIGPLLKLINQDILDEETDEIKEFLFKWAWKNVSRLVTSGFPEWYKQRLVKEMFEGE